MKTIRRMRTNKVLMTLMSVFLLAVLVLSTPNTALAADTYAITINNTESEHTYNAYQIFIGDYSDGTLTQIEWGSGITEAGKQAYNAEFENAGKKADTLKVEADARAFAEELVGKGYLGEAAATTSANPNNQYILSGLEAGYYMVTDTTATGTVSAYIVKVLGSDTNVSPKTGAPTFEKKVQDINDSTAESSGLQDTADYDIGDAVPFTITITLPENYASFKSYYLAVTDNLSKGLELNEETIQITMPNGTVVDKKTIDTDSNYECFINPTEASDDTVDFKLVIKDLKEAYASAIAGQTIIITYTATLTDDAIIGNDGNTNEATLTYQSNPNYEGSIIPGDFEEDGDLKDDEPDSDDDGKPDNEDKDEDDDKDGDTDNEPDNEPGQPNDEDGDGIPDDGDNDDDNDGIPDDEDDDDADDVLNDSKPDEVVVFTYELVIDKITGANTETDKNYAALKGATFSLYKLGGAGTVAWTENAGYKLVEKITGEDSSVFEFAGLDDGEYVLVEDEAPNGYNKIDPIHFTISAAHDEKLTDLTATVTDGSATFTGVVTEGKLTKLDHSEKAVTSGQIFTEVINNSGTVLPSTGGVGTTMFYLLGAVCVIGASVLLVTKRVMSKKAIN